MLLPVKWLKEYVDIDIDIKKLADKLTLSGSHVESIISLDKGVENVVVGKILDIKKHPNADRLVITNIDVGDEQLQIITGANNIQEGDYVPVALVGAKLPGGVKIKKSKLRGLESYGMLCSAKELGIDDNVVPKYQKDGIYILDKDYPLGMDIREVLGLDGEVIEFEITPNRPDCLSIIGMARETKATFNCKIEYPDISISNEYDDINDYLKKVEILDKDLCSKYYCKVVKDLKISQSPLWMQQRLMQAGVRPINNIVDITNYVMLEMGQPIHAFDLSKLIDERIYVRRAYDGEKIVSLDEVERSLTSDDLVIADGERPVAIAGVMGGLETEVIDSTSLVLIESANFDSKNIRLTSKRLGLRTEASSRFEKGIDIGLCEIACNRVCQLIEEIGAGKVVKGFYDEGTSKVDSTEIILRPERVCKLLGTQISLANMIKILEMLEFEVEEQDEVLKVKVPSFRLDIKKEVDLIEEIGRIYGFHNIPNKPLVGKLIRGIKPYEKIVEDKTKDILMGLGLNEVMTYSFISPKAYNMINIPNGSIKRKYIKILNPLGGDYSVMRTTIITNMMDLIARNYNYGVDRVCAFEIGNIFIPRELPLENLPIERKTLCIGMYGKEIDYFALKGVIDILFERLGIDEWEYLREEKHKTFHPGRAANIVSKGRVLGLLGETNPDVIENYDINKRVYIAELDFDGINELANLNQRYRPLPKYPAITRDLAIVVDENTMVKDLEKMIWNLGEGLIEDIKLFDVYIGDQIPEGKKSVAYSIVYRSYERTLKDEEINKVQNSIIANLEDVFNAELRS